MTMGAKIGAGFALGMAIIVAIGVTAYVSTQRLLEANRWVTHTHEVIEGLDHVLLVLTDADTRLRGFLVTGEERYLQPNVAAEGRVQHDIDAVVDLTRDNAAQQESLRQVQKLADAKLALLREMIEVRRKSGLEAALWVILTDWDKKIMDELRGAIAEMEDREQQLLDKRTRGGEDQRRSDHLDDCRVDAHRLARVGRGGRGPDAGQCASADPFAPRRKWGRVAVQYAAALLAVAVAAGLRWRLEGSFGALPLFLTFYPAVLLVAIIGGGGPGTAATVLSALVADYWFIEPYHSLRIDAPNDVVALGIFTGTCLFLSVIGERLRRARWAEAISVAQEQQLEELSRLNEELSQQSEELSQQSEELAQQNEELQTQSEEIQALNTELRHREDILYVLLDAASLGAAEQTVMHDICAAAEENVRPGRRGRPRVGAARRPGGGRGHAGLGPEGAKMEWLPAVNCLAEVAIAENKTAALADAALRPDLALVHPPGEEPYRAALAAPMRSGGLPFGAVGIYSRQTQEWTAEQFHLAEWLAAQCAHILETLRLREQMRRLHEEQQTIFNSVPAMIWHKDTKNNFVRVNRAVASAVGRPLDAIEGKSAYEIFPDEAERYYQDDLEVINSGRPKLGIVEELGTASGEKRWVRRQDPLPGRKGRHYRRVALHPGHHRAEAGRGGPAGKRVAPACRHGQQP